jgi:hypothetical protein
VRRLKRYCLNLLIVTYLGVIYFSGFPESNTLNFRLKQSALEVAYGVGIWPSWSMFAPNPIKFDSKTYAVISFKNGSGFIRDVEIDTSGLLSSMRKARWMKYSQDNLRNPHQQKLLAPALRYFYHQYNSIQTPIHSIRLLRKWEEIALLNESEKLPPLRATPRMQKEENLIVQNF